MKGSSQSSLTTIGAILLGSLLLSSAQPAPERGPDRSQPSGEFRRGQGQPGRRAQAVPGLDRIFAVLNLEQRTSLRDALQPSGEKMRAVEEKLREARKDLLEKCVAENFDKEAIRNKAVEVGKLEAERTVLFAEAFSKVRPRLTEEQLEKIKNPPPPEPGGRPALRPEGQPETPPRDGRRPERDANDLPPPPKP
jgi:Spy/CpxP family protein refolding chaperone